MMEKTLKKLSRVLQAEYWSFLALAALMAAAYEAGWLQEGAYAGDARLQYIWNTVGILVTLAAVPLALKLFSVVMAKRINPAPLQEALRLYRRWNGVRLAINSAMILLAASTFFNLYVYYATLDNIGGLCALISITASFFCIPNEKRIKDELNINGQAT